ncbi:MAG: AMMECR1 domain-containing protein [Planctomycetota bacterium]|jgi:AMMECR1 domain-containing protein
MDDTQKQTLLKVARDIVEAVIKGGETPKPESDDPQLNAHCGCFVTLKNKGRLRGCIGRFISDIPLIELVVEMAKASATGDPRFFADPITADELEHVDIEISVLSPVFCLRLPQRPDGQKRNFSPTAAHIRPALPLMPGKTRKPKFPYSPPKCSVPTSGIYSPMICLIPSG